MMLRWRALLLLLTLSLPGLPPATPARAADAMPARLAPCPDSPNCVSSDAADAGHRVEAFTLALPADAAWREIAAAVKALPRTTLAQLTGDYLRAECKSMVFRFVDDLELELRAGQGVVAVRSASRVGHSDFGVNRRRVERLREALRSRGVIR